MTVFISSINILGRYCLSRGYDTLVNRSVNLNRYPRRRSIGMFVQHYPIYTNKLGNNNVYASSSALMTLKSNVSLRRVCYNRRI